MMRRTILILAATVVMLALLILLAPVCATSELSLRVGIITDMHLTRPEYFPERDDYLTKFVSRMNDWSPDFVIELGDAIEHGTAVDVLDKFEAIYSDLIPPRYYVLGNHELFGYVPKYGLNPDRGREVYLAHTNATACYYSFDHGDFHFIVLDTAEEIIGKTQMNWLRSDLASSHKKTFVFTHVPLDPIHPGDLQRTPPADDAAEARAALEEDGDVVAVFVGHRHVNYYSCINGIDYYTLDNTYVQPERAWAEDLPYTWSELYIFSDGSIWLEGFGSQVDLGVNPGSIARTQWLFARRQWLVVGVIAAGVLAGVAAIYLIARLKETD